ncbi:MAG: lipoyl(octanoyl) transferase LipB [Gemmatimonadota bacterium]
MRRRILATRVPGRSRYGTAWDAQRALARARIDGGIDTDWLVLLEHQPVVTLGRAAPRGHVVASPARLAELGIECVEIERGGDVTYHGPGQLVGYPILDLGRFRRDLHWYVRRLEEALIRGLGRLGLPALRVPGRTGVWVRGASSHLGRRAPSEREPGGEELRSPLDPAAPRKLASIGVHVSRWVTWHGFALNVSEASLERFDLIVPCGLPGVRMTSLESEGVRVERGVESPRLREAVLAGFALAFECPVEWVRWERVSEVGGPAVARALAPLEKPALEMGAVEAETVEAGARQAGAREAGAGAPEAGLRPAGDVGGAVRR